jgi:hypothetical protein
MAGWMAWVDGWHYGTSESLLGMGLWDGWDGWGDRLQTALDMPRQTDRASQLNNEIGLFKIEPTRTALPSF